MQIAQKGLVRQMVTDMKTPAIIGLILIGPWLILETWRATLDRQNATGLVILFALLWFLPAAFVWALVPVVRSVREGSSLAAAPVALMLRFTFLVLIAAVWAGILVDQLPCFLGVPNCD